MTLKIGNQTIGSNYPTYFIADIAANHDGSLDRAKMLIRLAKDAGADAAKFQNFRAKKIVSDYGFTHMNAQVSHQAKWEKSVSEVYASASIPFEWTPILKDICDEVGIHYFSSPYDFDAIDMLELYVPAYKIGSGDITWVEACERIASKGKPVLLATGASDIGDVQRAVQAILAINSQLVLMQCNTNYTAAEENFSNIHLNVLNTYRSMYPDLVLGLSDHTHGHATVLGAVALGARVIEKHFTDDNDRVGPDHPFAMNPESWKAMVRATRQLETAMGSGDKFVTENEQETVVIQRRCLRAARTIKPNEIINREMVDVLRPATQGAIMPYEIQDLLGLKALERIAVGQELRWAQFGNP
jgi:sialic acid synthase SpsE